MTRLSWTLDLLRLDRERVLRGWTRGELARRAQVDEGTVSDMFRSRRRPTLGTVQAISVALGLVLADVIVFAEPARDQSEAA
jgi:transcriptional regulator with XRE-family HTH domain